MNYYKYRNVRYMRLKTVPGVTVLFLAALCFIPVIFLVWYVVSTALKQQ